MCEKGLEADKMDEWEDGEGEANRGLKVIKCIINMFGILE